MELTALTEKLKSVAFKFLRMDYIYLHKKSEYPLFKDMDFENFYFVTENSGNDKVKVIGLLTEDEREFTIKELETGNWWFLRVPSEAKLFNS